MLSQVRLARRALNATPLPYTASPLKLVLSDICLIVQNAWALPDIVLPLCLGRTNPLNELHPSFQSGVSVLGQVFLTVGQVLFLISVPLAIISMIPALWIMIYVATCLLMNYAICMLLLNGFQRVLVSQVPVDEQPGHEREQWFFINGVAGGHYWLQNSIDQLSYTFGRKVTGIHNRTAGLTFDLIECLIQRGFAYATDDVRSAHTLVKKALLNPACEKVVLILHSQGGIEGGLIIDWLLDEMPQDLLEQLEVYTFGNAANHFNNPRRTLQCGPDEGSRVRRANRSVGYIEHYANAADPVAWLGVLRFANIPNRYMGLLFVRQGSGHLLNQHYLDNMFTLGPDMRVLESNPFMDMEVETKTDPTSGNAVSRSEESDEDREKALLPISNIDRSRQASEPEYHREVLRVKNFSRLWEYRNGGSPERQKSD